MAGGTGQGVRGARRGERGTPVRASAAIATDSSTTQVPAGYAAAARRALPFALAAAAFGISFGVLAQSAGMGKLAPVLMSATTFGGSAQFAVASILAGGGAAAAAVLSAVLLNARYAPMALAAAPALRGGRARRSLEAQLVVDESWALANRGGRFDRRTLIAAGLVLYVGWVGGTLVGVLAGGALGDPEALGLDAAFPALFLALVATQIRSRQALTAALLGAALALALVPVAPPGVPIIAATLACLIGLRQTEGAA
jgi:4-azaleucine resistance transporter AzlC